MDTFAPPYDVISPQMQEELYQKSPYNVVRLEYGKEFQADNEMSNRYTRAADDFKKWLESRALVRDEAPAIYPYEQGYIGKNGNIKTRKGFIARVRLEELDSGVILPHERTLSGPKTDRLKLIKACRANFSPIFSLYSDPEMKTNTLLSGAAQNSPIINFKDEEGISHRLWRVADEEVIKRLQEEIADKMLFIADGHHRYETALNYRNEVIKTHPHFTGTESFNYTLMYFSNMDDEGLTVFPTHRLIYGLRDFNPGLFEERLSENFEIERFQDIRENLKTFLERLSEKGKDTHSFGVYAKGWDNAAIVTLKSEVTMDGFATEHSIAYRRLDVTILHTLIIENILGISRERQERKENIEYIQGEMAGLSKVMDGDRQILFILNPTKVREVEEVAKAKDKMPQKSTYFYPKIPTGLVINVIDRRTS